MTILLELLGLGLLGLVVWTMYRMAAARPVEHGYLHAARAGMAAWVVFVLWTLIDINYIRENAAGIRQVLVFFIVMGGLILGYRALLSRLKDRAQ